MVIASLCFTESVFHGYGLSTEILGDHDKLWVSKFWHALHKRLSIELKFSTVFHLETDGASERTNKTVIQLLQNHTDNHQGNWAATLPCVEFAMNASTGKCPYELVIGFCPCLLPAIFPVDLNASNMPSPSEFIRQLEHNLTDSQDNLLAAKPHQATQTNKHHHTEDIYTVGELVLVNTCDRQHLYKVKGWKRSAKLMPHCSGPYEVLEAFPELSNCRRKLADGNKTHPVFIVQAEAVH